jgi:pyruvate dehydrogenase E1 component beta subunit
MDVEVLDLRTLRPLDEESILTSVRKTHKAVIAEEDWKTGGMGAEVTSVILSGAFDYLDAPVVRVALADVPMPYAKPLEQAAIPSVDDIAASIRKIMGKG